MPWLEAETATEAGTEIADATVQDPAADKSKTVELVEEHTTRTDTELEDGTSEICVLAEEPKMAECVDFPALGAGQTQI